MIVLLLWLVLSARIHYLLLNHLCCHDNGDVLEVRIYQFSRPRSPTIVRFVHGALLPDVLEDLVLSLSEPLPLLRLHLLPFGSDAVIHK